MNGRLVFARAGGAYGDESLFLTSIMGGNEQTLGQPGSTGGPFVSHDFKLLVIAGSGRDGRFAPVIIDLTDTTKQRQLDAPARSTLNVGSGPFSPDDRLIATEGFDDAKPDLHAIYLIRVSDGGGLTRLTPSAFIPGDWSPDGKMLLLFKGADGEPPPPGSLWLANRDGSNQHELTQHVQCCFNYRFSPDGARVLFAGADGVLRTIDVDGSHLTEIYRDPDGGYAITPAWSPDGSLIVFGLEASPNPFSHPNNAFYVIRADGSGLTQVLGGADFKREPIWIPDG